MNKEELIGKLQMVYVGEKNALDELVGYYDGLQEIIKIIREENKQLKDNWNKLKKELKDKFEEYRYVEDECLKTMAQEDDSILFSMKCIESGDSNE